MRPIHLIAAALVLGTAGPLSAATKSESWADPNYVPCEGLGASASGRVDATLTYAVEGSTVRVTSVVLDLQYGPHAFEPSGTLEFTRPDGSSGKILLQEPWFPVVAPRGSSRRSLYLPRNGSAAGPAGQSSFAMRTSTAITITVATRFPQDGGNCFATFSAQTTVP